jgi:hypothetical protein
MPFHRIGVRARPMVGRVRPVPLQDPSQSLKGTCGDRSMREDGQSRFDQSGKVRAARRRDQPTHILSIQKQHIISAQMGRVAVHQFLGDGLSVEPLLQIVERLNAAIPNNQQVRRPARR